MAGGLLIKAVLCVRSEPTTLGPLPQGAENQCSGRGAFSIDSHLPPPIHPPSTICPVRSGRVCTESLEVNSWTLQVRVGGWMDVWSGCYCNAVCVIYFHNS